MGLVVLFKMILLEKDWDWKKEVACGGWNLFWNSIAFEVNKGS